MVNSQAFAFVPCWKPVCFQIGFLHQIIGIRFMMGEVKDEVIERINKRQEFTLK